jgi:hypothetical protein
MRAPLFLPLLFLLSCDDALFGDYGPPEAPEVSSSAPAMRRLTESQYHHAIRDLFGPDVVIATGLEPDQQVSGLYAIGTTAGTVSPLGVEQFETAAFQIAGQVMDDSALRDAVLPCTPDGIVDDGCASLAITELGRRVWRRPLDDEEVETLVSIASASSTALSSFDLGFEFAIAALLQSPNFVYRIELGEEHPDLPGMYRYTDFDMASRLAFFLWDSTPDDTLLDAAAAGELTTDQGLADQVDRMLADDRARDGVRAFFFDMMALSALDSLSKDTTIFVAYNETIGPSAREETLMALEYLVVDEDGDYRDIFTSQRTFVNPKLASMYGVQAPNRDGFGMVELPSDANRRGLLGHASILALHAHPVSSSATRRGIFIRENLLCHDIPPPPSNLSTGIPEESANAPTLRDRVATHLSDPFCAQCHNMTDLIGLGLENYDGLGMWRTHENGALIDPSGDVDGDEFANAWDLGRAMHDHPDTSNCLVETAWRVSGGQRIYSGERDLVDYLQWKFSDDGYRVKQLWRDIALSDGFRRVGGVE